jgi:hypothetical protein
LTCHVANWQTSRAKVVLVWQQGQFEDAVTAKPP